MTAIHLPSFRDAVHLPRRHTALGTLSRIGHRALATLREWRRRSRDRAELASLDWRMLQDIGLSPSEADFLANQPFWRE